MGKLGQRERALDALYEGYFGEDRYSFIAIRPRVKSNSSLDSKSNFASSTSLLSESSSCANAPEIDLLKFFADEYLNLYIHYDNQRNHYANVLLVAVGGFSLAPFALARDPVASDLQGWLVGGSFVIIFILAVLGMMATEKFRFRMKTVYHRFGLIREHLNKLCPSAGLEENAKKGKDLAINEMKLRSDYKDKGMTRGLLWMLLPWLVIAYAMFYTALYFCLK